MRGEILTFDAVAGRHFELSVCFIEGRLLLFESCAFICGN